jgi:hypothetical protein
MIHQSRQWLLIIGLLAVGVAAVGCLNRDLAPADPSTQSGVFVEIQQTGTTKVDILFMVDNSNSMNEEQGVLSKQIVLMAEELIHPSTPETPAVQDLHIGIVTSDMGTHGYSILTCREAMNGDNGILQNIGRTEGCQPSYSSPDCSRAECPWLTHSVESPDDGSNGTPPIWDDFGCIATLGTGGCGFEQQLESALVAVTTQSEPGRPNEGFLRNDSLIAIIFVTDEDDCSTPNGELFNPAREDFGPMNVRCAINPGDLYPIERYYDGFTGLRRGNEDLVVVAAITGIPIDGSWNVGESLDRLRDLQQVNPNNSNELIPSCQTGMGLAFPPVRIVDLVYRFDNNGVLASICNADWTSALQAITRKIQDKLPGACMTRQLASTDPGVCRVIETLGDERGCPSPSDTVGSDRSHGWHLDLGLDDNGRRMCEILPADYNGDGCPDGVSQADCDSDNFGPTTSALQGWFYDNADPSCEFGQVRFTTTDVTSDLSTVRFECRTALCPLRRQCAAAGTSLANCNPNEPGTCDGACVRHNSGDICGWDEEGRARSCARCSLTLEGTCSLIADDCRENPTRRYAFGCDEALVQAGGCCAEGFHCENGECQPDRTTTCR